MVVNQQIVETIKKLFALGGNNPSELEAAAAIEKAHKLMKKYGIDSIELDADNGSEMDIKGWESDWLSQVDSYSKILSHAVAKLFDLQQWMVRPGKKHGYKVKVCFAGEATDLAIGIEVWPYLVNMAKRLASKYAGSGWTPSHRSFAEAFATRIYGRVKEMREQEKEQAWEDKLEGNKTAEQQENASYALVVAKKEEHLEKWFANMGINLKVGKPRKMTGQYDPFAGAAGARAGAQVNLNFRKQVGNTDQPRIR